MLNVKWSFSFSFIFLGWDQSPRLLRLHQLGWSFTEEDSSPVHTESGKYFQKSLLLIQYFFHVLKLHLSKSILTNIIIYCMLYFYMLFAFLWSSILYFLLCRTLFVISQTLTPSSPRRWFPSQSAGPKNTPLSTLVSWRLTMPLWASLMLRLLRILFYETFHTRCLFALTIMTYFDKREEFILWTNFFCEAKVSSWEETALKTDFGQKIYIYILPICIYINIYAYR